MSDSVQEMQNFENVIHILFITVFYSEFNGLYGNKIVELDPGQIGLKQNDIERTSDLRWNA